MQKQEELLSQIKDKYNQPFFIGYNMLTESLKHKDIKNGLSKSLGMAQIFLDSDNVIIYKKSHNDKYQDFKNSSLSKDNDISIRDYINNRDIRNIIYCKEYYFENNKINNMSILPITSDKEYILVIVNSKKIDSKDYNIFLSILKDTFELLIGKMNNYNEMKEQTEIDALTGLKNRQSYNKDIELINKGNEKVTFTILDLFRLKYINDNINHFTGDCYIKKTAEILKKFFPPTIKINGELIKTGDEVYRIGGDEFIIISRSKSDRQIEVIMEYVMLQIEEMDLDISSDIIKGINYGTVTRNNGETTDELYKKADKELSEDKQKAYIRYGLNRRR